MCNNKYLYIEIELLKEKLKKSIVNLFFYIKYLDISLVSLIEEVKRCHMFTSLPYIDCLDTVDEIHIWDVDDLFKVKDNLKSYCKKNKLIEFIFLHEIYLEKNYKEYKRIALKDLDKKSGNYVMIAKFALEIG